MRYRIALGLAAVAALIFPENASALISNITQGTSHNTIQEAIDVSSNGDEILVGTGAYPERIDLRGKAIWLRSASGPGGTSIWGDGTGSTVTCQTGEGADTVIEGFLISGGNAELGGGVYIELASPQFIDCVISGNTAIDGGGVAVKNHGRPHLVNCAIVGNVATDWGGGVYAYAGGKPELTSCAIARNGASVGGGVRGFFSGEVSLVNSTITDNWAHDDGGGLYLSSWTPGTLINCIVWGNSTSQGGRQIVNEHDSTLVMTYSCIESGWPGTGNIDADPLIFDPGIPYGFPGSPNDGLHLLAGSPCINAGNDSAVTNPSFTDIDGEARIQQCRVDMGVDETPFGADCNGNGIADACDISGGTSVDCNANDIPDSCDLMAGTATDLDQSGVPDICERVRNVTQDTYTMTIQAAIDASTNGDRIDVGPGTYNERIDLLGKAITLQSTAGADATIIDGNVYGGGSVVTCDSGEGPDTLIIGFTITGGQAIRGGGVHIQYGSSPRLVSCRILANAATSQGGGLWAGDTVAPQLYDCEFRDNIAGYGGGGLYIVGDGAVLNCVFGGNTSLDSIGGGAACSGYDLVFTNCTFAGNSAPNGPGGGVFATGATSIINCTFAGNSAPNGLGGGVYAIGATSIINGTILGNSAVGGGGLSIGADCQVLNCLVWGNAAAENAQIRATVPGTSVTYCLVQGDWPGKGNLDLDPQLVDADGPDDVFGSPDDDVHLLPGSPCINAGKPLFSPSGISIDFEGDPRHQHCRIDIGVDETPYVQADCNSNGLDDACDLRDLTELDCNSNGVPDSCDIASGDSADIDTDGVPDDCQAVFNITQVTRHATIQEAIEAAAGGDLIEVGPGEYVENIILRGKAITLRSTDGPAATILDGDDFASVITCMDGEGPDTIIEGFTVTNGRGWPGSGRGGGYELATGGGIHCLQSSPTVIHCVFRGNKADSYGGGAYASGCSPSFIGCSFSGNTANGFGGGVFNYDQSSPTFLHCTFFGNSADTGGAMSNLNSCDPLLKNCVVWRNTANTAPQVYDHYECTTTVGYSCVQGGWPGTGNIASDPLFFNPAGYDNVPGTADDDLRLRSGSPCIDAGDNAAVPADAWDLDGDGDTVESLPFDLASAPRFYDDPTTQDTGSGTAPLVDMGAFEVQPVSDDCASTGAVGQEDLQELVICLDGPGAAMQWACGCSDVDDDGDVDLADFAAIQALWSSAD